MSLPSLATLTDVLARAPEMQSGLDPLQVEALLDDASAILRSFAGREWVNTTRDALEDVPDGVTGIVALMVIRALRVPEGVTQETVGNYSVSYAVTASDRLYLTKTEKAFIKRAAARGMGAFSIDTYGAVGYLGIEEDADWTL